jgi:hypothetical protein
MRQIFLVLICCFSLTVMGACSAAPAAATNMEATPTRETGTTESMLSATSTPTLTLPPANTPTAVTPTVPAAFPVATMENVPTLSAYQTYGMRLLEEPVGVTRAGITVAVEQVNVYANQVELVYTVRNIPQDGLFDPFEDDNSLSCGGPESYPNLILPDGTVIFPENYLLDGKASDIFQPLVNSYLIHVYQSTIPDEITDLTLALHCLELARLDSAPLNWEIPFRIVGVK